MARQVKLRTTVRDDGGKAVARRLRSEGRVPAVVYGHGTEPVAVQVDALELYRVLHTSAGRNVLIRLEVDGSEHLAMAREVQRHPVRGDVMHVDFLAVDRTQKIEVEVTVHLAGAEDVASPGVVAHVLHTVPIRVKPTEVPDRFDLDIADMVIGDVRRVGDLALPQDAEWAIDPERTVVTVVAPTVEPEVEEAVEEAVEGEPVEGEPVEGDVEPGEAAADTHAS